MIGIQEFFVVQTQPKGFVNLWEDTLDSVRHETKEAAFAASDKLADVNPLMEVRVVRRWK